MPKRFVVHGKRLEPRAFVSLRGSRGARKSAPSRAAKRRIAIQPFFERESFDLAGDAQSGNGLPSKSVIGPMPDFPASNEARYRARISQRRHGAIPVTNHSAF